MKRTDSTWPPPADLEAAARLNSQFAALGRAELKFTHSAQGAAALNALGGNAPYLADLALAEPKTLMQALVNPQTVIEGLLARLSKIPPTVSHAEIAKKLRIAKRQAALTIAVADIGGTWSLSQVTQALSVLAETSLRVAIRHLLRSLHDQSNITLPNPAEPDQKCGFVALALGKLGAFELNYSSDIDLVLIYDPQSPVYPPEAQVTMARLARDLVSLFSVRDEHGYVFRVDLRLRPDPAATPPVISLPAALTYYESHGRTWERAAFSKARPLAGDIALGEMFLAAIRPFIWRRHLDFAAIADIRGMKRQIDARQTASGLLGHDVKLGRGGIREIEFIVQTLSLVWGGADPALRIPQTLRALPALARARHLPEAAARELAADYQTLRRVEHRLQMVADRQTHSLPATQQALQQFAIFLNDPGFLKSFPKLLSRVHGHFLGFFDADSGPATVIDPGETGKPPLDFTIKLKALGFNDFQHMAERLRAWSSGGIPALRSERARELLETLVPHLLEALGRQKDPDRAFRLFDTLISRQRAGVQLLSLFARNPPLLQRLATVLGAAPVLAEHLAQDAQALEVLLSPAARFGRVGSFRPALARLLQEAVDLEGVVSITRRFVRREEFHLSVATLEGRLDANEAGRLRSNLAKAALSTLLPHIMAQHIARFGRIRRMSFGVVALGKTGSAEMLAGSDLDLMLIYDHAPMDTPPTHYFVRLAHALTAALTAHGPEGPIYQVDMRLRPSGNQGPVAVSLAAFRRYHATESWTWERMALTRASVLAATPKFEPILSKEILIALARPEQATTIRADVGAMLARINTDMPPKGMWDVKHCIGGLIELAFIAEALQLIHGPTNPALFYANTAAALRALAAAGHVSGVDAATLLAADQLWRTIQGMSRIIGLHERDEHPQAATLAPLLRATGTIDVAQLTLTIEQHRAAVRDCFVRIIGPVT
ncbi:MAG: bifunctional [glutamine synthetase] adenylyltransferase/[glutamine synthetase]-adenylyl-L-tyrosine phosphorylase [Acidocella sp.]|nr:bifunctional [glutamine synthetase] adenylyltransferase/[glutamine synthetase]-adenylyl-L-tyrosine phosphorylase [Acidocella sp.]